MNYHQSNSVSIPKTRWLPLIPLIVVLSFAGATVAQAQVFPAPEAEVFFDSFESYTATQSSNWDISTPYWQWNQKSISSWTSKFWVDSAMPSRADNGVWGSKHLTNLYSYILNSSMLVLRPSIPPSGPWGAENNDSLNYDPDDWTNIRIEIDIGVTQLGVYGIFWGMTGADDFTDHPTGMRPTDGYVFWINGTTSSNDGFPGNYWQLDRNGAWHLARIQGWDRTKSHTGQMDWIPIHPDTLSSTGQDIVPDVPGWLVEPPALPNPTGGTSSDWLSMKYMLSARQYRFRLDWFCGNLRIQYQQVYGDLEDNGAHPAGTRYIGCDPLGTSDGCISTNSDECWCTVEEINLAAMDAADGRAVINDPGMVGIYFSNLWSSNMTPNWGHNWDNFRVSKLPATCGIVCGPWTSWSDANTDTIPFKLLYEGSLFDYSAGRQIQPPRSPNWSDRGKIDVNTDGPLPISTFNHSLIDQDTGTKNPYCNGWNLLEDLPGPAGASNLSNIAALLEPMSTAVTFYNDGTSTGFSWDKDYQNDSALPGYDPVPLITDGTTPINSALLEAFDWYNEQRTIGAWASDPYEDCRKWYVVLITDGEEGCEFESCSEGDPGCFYSDGQAGWYKADPDKVCEPGQAASKFANPPSGIDPVPVYTIGFSESVSEDSPLACIAEETGGLFLPARNASQLSDALYEVFYVLEGGSSTFVPYKVSPPPNSVGGSATRDYLAVYPLFTPVDEVTLWPGNLFAFPLNKAVPDLEWTEDCDLDTTNMVWDVASVMAEQLVLHDEGTPRRFVYMSSASTGSWVRHDLATIPTNAVLKNDFKALLDVTGTPSDVDTQQIVNFVRNIYMDNDSDVTNTNPPAAPRPDGYPEFGDFFHSQPLIVNPPNTSTYYYNYGFEAAGEQGAHNYAQFMTENAKRRRLVMAGANDGMLHVFDGGVWDRNRIDEDEDYDKIHDLGTGVELFAYVPQAVMNRLHDLTAGGTFNNVEPQWLVDGHVVKSDVFIDAVGDSDREWRTAAFTTMRRGGRGVLALDITRPDPIGAAPDYKPHTSLFSGCRDGSDSNCDGQWPEILWEFKDETDADGNCTTGLSGDDCAPFWDLGWTWSKPAVARIAVYDGAGDPPEDIFVAFFGGGWDRTNNDQTGIHFYGVNVETGAIVYKYTDPDAAERYDMPGGVTALDSDADGFHDRIYFADSNGRVYRLQFPDPTDSAATGAGAGTLTTIFDFRSSFSDGGFPDRQEFFTRPITVPTLFDGGNFTWGLALGSGDRAGLARTDSGVDHFFFLLDAGDTTTRGKADLLAVSYADLDGTFTCPTDALSPSEGYYGWYLSLRDTEKVMYDSTVVGGYVYFTTFDPSTQTGSHRVPNQCGGRPEEEVDPEGGIELDVVCRASGIGRSYELWYECGMGDYREYNDIVTGNESTDASGDTEVYFPGRKGEKKEKPDIPPTYNVTNWRQE